MNSDDDMERQLDEIAETLETTIRTLVRAHPGIEIDDLAERATNELLSDHEAAAPSPTASGDVDQMSYVDLQDLITDLVYSQAFELCDQHGPLIETSDGKLLDLSHMVTDKVFTHRVGRTESEPSGWCSGSTSGRCRGRASPQ